MLQEFPASRPNQYINWVAFGGDKDSGFFRAKLLADYSAASGRSDKLNVEVGNDSEVAEVQPYAGAVLRRLGPAHADTACALQAVAAHDASHRPVHTLVGAAAGPPPSIIHDRVALTVSFLVHLQFVETTFMLGPLEFMQKFPAGRGGWWRLTYVDNDYRIL